jgi:PD-(D/E)XK nuclease superfamily
MEFDDLSNRVIGCAIEVHRHLGPGLLESAYFLRALRVRRGKINDPTCQLPGIAWKACRTIGCTKDAERCVLTMERSLRRLGDPCR